MRSSLTRVELTVLSIYYVSFAFLYKLKMFEWNAAFQLNHILKMERTPIKNNKLFTVGLPAKLLRVMVTSAHHTRIYQSLGFFSRRSPHHIETLGYTELEFMNTVCIIIIWNANMYINFESHVFQDMLWRKILDVNVPFRLSMLHMWSGTRIRYTY